MLILVAAWFFFPFALPTHEAFAEELAAETIVEPDVMSEEATVEEEMNTEPNPCTPAPDTETGAAELPEATPAPDTETGAAELPEATPAPESSATPAPDLPEATPVPEELPITPAPTTAPDETIEPMPTLETVIDATIEPQETEETANDIKLLKKVDASEYYHLSAAQLCIPDGGMAIPQLYQGDYRLPVCRYRGTNKSVATSGCGATAASMLIAYVTENTDQTPYTLFYWAAEHGKYRGDGLSFSTVRQLLSNHGVHSRMQNVSADTICEALNAGQPIIMLMGAGTFTREGHYIVLRGLDANGQVMVNDPASASRSATHYSLNLIVREAKGSEMLVVTNRTKNKTSPVANAVQETPAPSATPAPAETAYSAVVAVECVNLRTEIGVQGEIATQLTQGTQLQVLEEYTLSSGNVWCRVLYQEQELYMRADMLERQN